MILRMLFLPLAIVFVYSCGTSYNLYELKTLVSEQKTMYERMIDQLDSLDRRRFEKTERRELDEYTAKMMAGRIDTLRKQLQVSLEKANEYLAEPYGNNLKKAKHALATQKSGYAKAAENIAVISDLFESKTFQHYEMAAFFKPGEYLTDSNYHAAKILTELCDDIASFASRHPATRLRGQFVVQGYADEQSIIPGSDLQKELLSSLKTNNASRQQLNKKLSELRSISITQVLRQVFARKMKSSSRIAMQYISEGRGEALPDPKTTNYKPDDERRRVVLIYWSAIPE